MIPIILALIGIGAANKDEPMSYTSLGSLVSSMCCMMMIIMGINRMPFKTPPMLGAMLLACCCCSSSTGSLVKDTQKRIQKMSSSEGSG